MLLFAVTIRNQYIPTPQIGLLTTKYEKYPNSQFYDFLLSDIRKVSPKIIKNINVLAYF